jgi:hypothetical protein
MKRRVLNGFAVLMLSAGVAFFQGRASAGNLPGHSVKVIPRVSNPIPPSSRPVSNNTRYVSPTTGHESRSTDAARVQNHTSETRNETRDQSRMTTRQRTESASATGERGNDAVCTNGNPKLIGVRCSANSECSWGARCVGQPARCANTGSPCLSNAQCMVPGVCSSGGVSSVSNRRGGTPARSVPVSRDGIASRIPTTASGRGVNHGVPSR